MGNKYSNAQVAASPGDMSRGIAQAFGDTEDEARKRKLAEDEAAQASAAQQSQQASGQVPSAWDTMKSMGGDAIAGAKDLASNPSGVWDTLTSGNKKKR